MVGGEHAEASKTFEKLFDLSGGIRTLIEDYGAAAGGFFFDYGLTLLPQGRWEDAKTAFTDCITAAEKAKEYDSPVRSENVRENLARFQLGFVESQLGNHEDALRLYDEYLAGNPPAEELSQVRNSFKLRYGASLMKLGRHEEGIDTVQELFDNREEWRVSPQFLVQGVLELGLGWVEQAMAAGGDEAVIEQISDRGHIFLDRNSEFIHLEPLASYRFGFVDRLRKLGFESAKAGLNSLALRYFSFVPTINEIRTDLHLTLARQAIGSGIPSQFQDVLDQLDQREQAEMHPDAETLRLVATSYERIGNLHAPRAIYWHLSEQFPQVPAQARAEILHEAARLSSLLADYSGAQYFGEKFMDEMPEDHPLKGNVSTFMLQSLFTSRLYDQVIQIAERVRERQEPGSDQRELADSLHPLALYSTQQHGDAEASFADYVKNYPDGPNREIVLFHRASNALILNKMREAAEHYEDFLKAFPESERFLDAALADLSIARFNLGDYGEAIRNVERLLAERPDSPQVPRSLNLKGDAYVIQGESLPREEAEKAAEMQDSGLAAYLAAIEAGQKSEASDPDRADFHKAVTAEAIWKATDLHYQREEIEQGISLYDSFFPAYAGTRYEPQISVFSLEHLEAAGRGEEGLVQVEKMINFLGGQPPEEQDLTLLRQAIGSYAEASQRIRGLEKTLVGFDDFPGLDPANQTLLTWLKIQKVIVLQGERRGKEQGSPEYNAIEAQIAEVFEELSLFEKRNLSEFALQQIGIYFAGTDNPFLGVPYFEELLARTNPEAEPFKGPAEMELGKIEMRSGDPGKIQSARERFRRIIADDSEDGRPLHAVAYMNLADLHIRNKEWRDAYEALDAINKNKSFFGRDRARRAEAGFKLGLVLEELGDPAAAQAYVAMMGAYPNIYDWITQAWERYIPLSLADIEAMETTDPVTTALKRERMLSLFRLTVRYVYSWQKLDERTDAPSGALGRLRRRVSEMKDEFRITPEEEARILREVGIEALP